MENCIPTWKRIKLDSILHHTHKTNSRWVKDLNIIPGRVKFLEENMVGKLLDNSLGTQFLDLTTKAKATKVKINKWDYIILNSFFTAKETFKN